jgi:histidinol-phosphate aminotransferase
MSYVSNIITFTPGTLPKSKATHGGTNLTERQNLGLDNAINDFSASISPLNISEEVFNVIKDINLSEYPDPECLSLKNSIASSIQKHENITINNNQIAIGNGSTELIYAIAAAFLLKPNTYGSEISFITPDHNKTGFIWDFQKAQHFIESNQPDLIFLCNPNNPTGTYFNNQEITALINSSEKSNTIIVIDEAYLDFSNTDERYTELIKTSNVLLLRSLTKSYGITGLRLGYCLGNSNLVSQIQHHIPPWSVNSLAQSAGIYLLDKNDKILPAIQSVDIAKQYLTSALAEIGYEIETSDANFLLIKVENALNTKMKLLKHNIMVRDCSSFGLPHHIRVGIKSLEDCEQLVAAIKNTN